MKKANKELIVKKALEMSKGFIWCFTKETSNSYIKDFAKKRFESLIELDIEVNRAFEDDSYEDYQPLFVRTFTNNIKELLPQKAKLEEDLNKRFCDF